MQTPKSDAQAEAGNYRKGHVTIHGLHIAIENPKGSTRSGTAPNGKRWSRKMKHDYGYIKGTNGRDGDHLDVFLGRAPDTELVFVVDQHVDGKFDEHKCLVGFFTEADARAAYLSNYEDGWPGLQAITALTIPQFKHWLATGDQKKPLAKQQVMALKRAVDSFYMQAIGQTPIRYDRQQGVMGNVLGHLQAIKSRGDRAINEAHSWDGLQNAADPNRSLARLQSFLAGQRQPLVTHPLDRILQGE